MSDQIKEVVKKTYTEAIKNRSGCGCGIDCCSDDSAQAFSDDYSKVDGYVADADYGLGCGIPTDGAGIEKGHTVLDLGSGAGNDVFVARKITGPEGRVIGVDMTEAMIEKALENTEKLGYRNVEFHLAEIEALPVDDNSVDVVLSNCVMNLVPDKKQAFSEVYRVLRPGAHFSISDIVLEGDLPEELATAAAMYAGCVAGAMQKSEYLSLIKQTGFTGLKISTEKRINLPDELLREFLTTDELTAFKNSGNKIISLTIQANKRH